MFAAATGKKPFLGTHGANPRYQPGSRGLLRGDVKAAAQGPRLTTALAPSKQTRRQGDTRGKTTPWWSCSPCRPWHTPKHAPSAARRVIAVAPLRSPQQNWGPTQRRGREPRPSAAAAGASGAEGGHQHGRAAELEATGFCTARGRAARVIRTDTQDLGAITTLTRWGRLSVVTARWGRLRQRRS